jgi:hypothetical protein
MGILKEMIFVGVKRCTSVGFFVFGGMLIYDENLFKDYEGVDGVISMSSGTCV